MNNIYLCGFMGCGKTTVGMRIAARTGRDFIDIDKMIEKKYGKIPDIFSAFGEDGFRRIETETIEYASLSDNKIISLGGGAVMRPENIEIAKKHGKLIFLDTPFNHCIVRIEGDKNRPLAARPRDELKKLYETRLPVYSKNADITLRPDKTPDKTALKIIRLIFGKDAANAYDRFAVYPTSYLYADEEHTLVADELIYGTGLSVVTDLGRNALYETEYGYRGYAAKQISANKTFTGTNTSTERVFSRTCDLLPSPEYKFAPVMTLPKGASVFLGKEVNERFIEVYLGKKTLYARKECFRNQFADLPVGERICANALEYLGTPYRFGGKTHDGIDCSGLAFMAHSLCGITIYRDAVFKEEYVIRISESELAPGDLIYFEGHVAVYLGDGNIIHASATAGKVEMRKLSELGLEIKAFARAKRL